MTITALETILIPLLRILVPPIIPIVIVIPILLIVFLVHRLITHPPSRFLSATIMASLSTPHTTFDTAKSTLCSYSQSRISESRTDFATPNFSVLLSTFWFRCRR